MNIIFKNIVLTFSNRLDILNIIIGGAADRYLRTEIAPHEVHWRILNYVTSIIPYLLKDVINIALLGCAPIPWLRQ